MLRKCVFLVMAVLVMVSAGASANETKKRALATGAAKQWLAIVDAAEYTQSWQQAAVHFKRAVQADQWVQSMKTYRTPLGKMLSRKVRSAVYHSSMPGAPDGEYVVIQFDTVFEKKQSAVETVTPMLDPDGRWRVSGYFIK